MHETHGKISSTIIGNKIAQIKLASKILHTIPIEINIHFMQNFDGDLILALALHAQAVVAFFAVFAV